MYINFKRTWEQASQAITGRILVLSLPEFGSLPVVIAQNVIFSFWYASKNLIK